MIPLSTAHEYHVIRRLINMAVSSGYLLETADRILDFGCGCGADVYRFRDLGFDAYGFDIHDYLQLRRSEDRRYFSILSSGSADKSNFTVDWDSFRLPYEDNSFHLLFSSQVVEHVQNHDRVYSEIARVMHPQGVSFHIFPPRYILIEPHIYVPLGSWINSRSYYLFWALMGVRNEYQQGLSPREVAEHNHRYAQAGLNYPAPRTILSIGRRYFSSADFVPQLWEQGTKFCTKLTNPWYRTYYTYTKNAVLRLEKPIIQRCKLLEP